MGGLVQGVVQEVTIEGAGGVYLSTGGGNHASVFRLDGTIRAIRVRDGQRTVIGEAEVSGKAEVRIGFDGAFFIYEYRSGDKWTRLGKSDIIGLVSYRGGISTNNRASDMSNYRVVKLDSLLGFVLATPTRRRFPVHRGWCTIRSAHSRARSIPAPFRRSIIPARHRPTPSCCLTAPTSTRGRTARVTRPSGRWATVFLSARKNPEPSARNKSSAACNCTSSGLLRRRSRAAARGGQLRRVPRRLVRGAGAG